MAAGGSQGEIRKLRKKLRQIENLERLDRDLTQEENEKISKKSEIRELLREKLQEIEVNDVEKVTESMKKTLEMNKGNDENEFSKEQSQEQAPARQTTLLQNELPEHKKLSEKDGDQSQKKSPQATKNLENGEKELSSSPSKTLDSKPSQSMQKRKAFDDWQETKFSIKQLDGHNDVISSVDMEGSVLLSGSRDTMFKVWDTDTGQEVRSMGGHTGGITSVVLVKKDTQNEQCGGYIGVTGSHDCSIRIWSLDDGQALRSMYVYSPVLSLDRRKGLLLSGSEAGKVELWDLEAGDNICSTRNTPDQVAVTCVKYMGEQIASGSSTGTVKVWDVRERSLSPAVSSYDENTIFTKTRQINCLATTDDVIYWGDSGTNIKALDLRAGKVRKLKNHLTEFGSTNALLVKDSLLISSGYDLDKGTGYLNVRSLPNEEYLATLNDEVTSYISCLCCTEVQKDTSLCQRLCTGGNELKIWDQLSKNKVRKRTRSESDTSFIKSKHLKQYSSSEQIDTESSDESDNDKRDDSSEDDDENEGGPTAVGQSWCTIS